MPPRVFLHVGSPKTGTTFLQNVLWTQRKRARQQGLILPLRSFHDHFRATLDVRELIGQPRYSGVEAGTWAALVREAEAAESTVLITHELFAAASYAQAEKAMAAFAPGTDVHVVATSRDLLRQVPAEWQEHLKHRYEHDFRYFLDSIQADPGHETWFWRVQDIPDVLDRWGHLLPRTNVHVVTVPPAGADPTILWRRFATLVGLDPDAFELEQSRSNTSLGAEQAEVLRRLNVALEDRLQMGDGYPGVVKEVLAHQVLTSRRGTPLRLTGADREFAVRRSADMAARLRDMGVSVVGDLDDLVPKVADDSGAWGETEVPAAPARPSITVPDAVLLDESIEALIGLAEKHKAVRDRFAAYRDDTNEERRAAAALRRRADDLRTERDQLRHDMHHRPIRHMLVGLSERWRVVMAVRLAFHRCKEWVRSSWRRMRSH